MVAAGRFIEEFIARGGAERRVEGRKRGKEAEEKGSALIRR